MANTTAAPVQQSPSIPDAHNSSGDRYDQHLILDRLLLPDAASDRERFEAFARAMRDRLAERWLKTNATYQLRDPKRVYYLSMEFLLGRSLRNTIENLGLADSATELARIHGIDLAGLEECEPDAGLGNGGLGRLAACFLDSLATLGFPAMGYGLRYEYGIFRQAMSDGWQIEQPDNWLRRPDPWEVARPSECVEVGLNCSFEIVHGTLTAVPGRPSRLRGIPYDRPVAGFGGRTVNTLRLWSAAAPEGFNFREFSSGDFVGAVAATLAAESLTRVLYPDDSTVAGQALRFVQEYFLVSCSLADLLRRFRATGDAWHRLPEKVAIQMNDTHPAMSVPELLRILLDDARLTWDEAIDITQRTLAYTNHTLLPEALERWPLHWFELMFPRHLELMYELNRRLLDSVRAQYPGDEGKVERISLIEEGTERRVRMANLAIVGSHSTNGVAAIHTRLLTTTTVRDLAELFPTRFNNKTNGVTPRRWLHHANPPLASVLNDAIGDRWCTDLDELARVLPLADDPAFQEAIRSAKRASKRQFTEWLRVTSGVSIDPDTMFDCQIKRIHEYKRQFLNALRIVVLYIRLREQPSAFVVPRTFFFAGKAAPAYQLAKVTIKFISNLADTLDRDPLSKGKLRVVFLPEYRVTLAERLIPASDLSNQISTAGFEASGTSNMKFMMNGALTIGTRDGATIEMAEAAGEENFFLFGLTAAEVAGSRSWYAPRWHYDHQQEVQAAMDLIASGHFNPEEPGVFQPLLDAIWVAGDRYMHLADLVSYLDADRRATSLYLDHKGWSRQVIRNIGASGRFSSDRTIAEYAREIWGILPCVEHDPAVVAAPRRV